MNYRSVKLRVLGTISDLFSLSLRLEIFSLKIFATLWLPILFAINLKLVLASKEAESQIPFRLRLIS